ncbi:MAG: SP family arabinose:H+ symporter-like MFS transporter [Cryomorphaceae bacterium]|jgi:SP family arabinose:H+ symporter-like MFS transporter
MNKTKFVVMVAMIVALGGFLMGFDASVISGVNKFIELEFELTKLQLGWAVGSLTLTATLAMMVAGPWSDRVGRKRVLTIAALLYTVSAVCSAFAPNFTFLVAARMLGGLGVGISLIIAPMYIAEISPPGMRGRMVSFNQLNIVLGISVAFFTNYLILQLGDSDAEWAKSLKFGEYNWRWMLGLEAVPAILYFFALFLVPRSPRWLAMKGNYDEAMTIMCKALDEKEAKKIIDDVRNSFKEKKEEKRSFKDLFHPSLRFVLIIGVVIGILQQITGINSVFFYAPMIFEQSGIGTDASFSQAILVGLINLAFTVLAISLIDKLGRKPLLVFGVSGMAIALFLLAYGFSSATYELSEESIQGITASVDAELLAPYIGEVYEDDLSFKAAMSEAIGDLEFKKHESQFLTAAVDMNAVLILVGILGFVASFAVSLGPVMWVLFSELFPNWIRGIAISFVGLINSAISFLVQVVFPWELEVLGSGTTFFIYGFFALVGVIFIVMKVPETKGKSLEELEAILVK